MNSSIVSCWVGIILFLSSVSLHQFRLCFAWLCLVSSSLFLGADRRTHTCGFCLTRHRYLHSSLLLAYMSIPFQFTSVSKSFHFPLHICFLHAHFVFVSPLFRAYLIVRCLLCTVMSLMGWFHACNKS